MYKKRFNLNGRLKSRKHCGAFAAAGGDLGAGEARTWRSVMKKLLVALTTVSAIGLYTASVAYAVDDSGGSSGNCNISALSCNGIGNGNTVTKNIDKTTVKVSVPIGSNNANKNSNTSGVVMGGIGIGGNTITQVGNNSQSFSGSHGK
jgi:hypothetical protein